MNCAKSIADKLTSKFEVNNVDIFRLCEKLNLKLVPNGYVYRTYRRGESTVEFNHVLDRKDLNYFIIYEIAYSLLQKDPYEDALAYLENLCSTLFVKQPA